MEFKHNKIMVKVCDRDGGQESITVSQRKKKSLIKESRRSWEKESKTKKIIK